MPYHLHCAKLFGNTVDRSELLQSMVRAIWNRRKRALSVGCGKREQRDSARNYKANGYGDGAPRFL